MSGEDYHFRFSGKIREGRLFFRLNMEYEGDEEVCSPRCRCALPPSCKIGVDGWGWGRVFGSGGAA